MMYGAPLQRRGPGRGCVRAGDHPEPAAGRPALRPAGPSFHDRARPLVDVGAAQLDAGHRAGPGCSALRRRRVPRPVLRDLRAAEPGAAGRPRRHRPSAWRRTPPWVPRSPPPAWSPGCWRPSSPGSALRWLFVTDAATCLACAAMVRLRLPGGPFPGTPEPGRPASPWRDRRLRLMMTTGTGFAVAVHDDDVRPAPGSASRRQCALGWAGALAALSAVTVIAGQPAPPSAPTRTRSCGMRSGYALLGAGLLLAGVATTRGSARAGGPSFPCWCGAWATRSSWASRWRSWPSWLTGPEGPRGPTAGRYLAAYGVSWVLATTVAAPLATALIALAGTSGPVVRLRRRGLHPVRGAEPGPGRGYPKVGSGP